MSGFVLPLPPLLQQWLPRRWRRPVVPPPGLWQAVVAQHPFLSRLTDGEQQRLLLLSGHFLQEKEFHGAHGLDITDAMALSVAAQACLPLLHMRPPSGQRSGDRLQVLDWYDDFVGIVIQPGAALARRRRADPAGVVHHYDEALAGEAMDRGPIMLSWEDVARAPTEAERGSNLVIHEFVHKIDMRGMQAGGSPDGAPALIGKWWGLRSEARAREHWRTTMSDAYDRFREQVSLAERFGGEAPWLDAYAATDPAEFFSVTSEAYFVARPAFEQWFPELLALYDGFYRAEA
jgi:MtfA peptidase